MLVFSKDTKVKEEKFRNNNTVFINSQKKDLSSVRPPADSCYPPAEGRVRQLADSGPFILFVDPFYFVN